MFSNSKWLKQCGPMVLALLSCHADAAIQIDGVLDESEWSKAQRFDQFVLVQPLSGQAAPEDRRAEAYLQSTPEGIAVAIKAWHPEAVAQLRNRIQRDGREAVDRMNVMIDFDADGRVAYDFTITSAGDVADQVVSNENSFNADWDGAWQHAVGNFEGGYVAEWLIPWSIAQMRNASASQRTIGVYFDRVFAATGERYAYPASSYAEPRFVSDFARVEIEQYHESKLAITPYAVGMYDQVGQASDFKMGGELFWKPSGDQQFALTLNPDFGQVESDDLVIDFSNVEVFFTDKRPFFTENQSYFDLQQSLGTVFYTRRVGGISDDGSGSSDIQAAAKGNGSFGRFGYGVFAAQEEGQAGREFELLRSTYDLGNLDLGLTRSRVERPFYDRTANVTAIDARWQPNERWLLRPVLMSSDSVTGNARQEGNAVGMTIDWDMAGPWRQKYYANYADKEFELNDLGYQARNNFRYLEWESGYRQDQLAEDSAFASHDWELELASNETTDGLLLRRTVLVQRNSELRDGGNLVSFLRWRDSGWDDRLSRGNGAVPLQSGVQLYAGRIRPRQGDGRIALGIDANIYPNAVSGYTGVVGFQPRFFLNDQFDVEVGLYRFWQSDWLLWQNGREFGSFRSNRFDLISNLNWFVDDRQELRVKLQAIAVDAHALQARRLDASGALVDSSEPLADFRVRNLGFQIRYRYKLAALSDIFVVYSRGGYAEEAHDGELGGYGLTDTLADAFSLRDADQLMIKLAYRFEL